MAKNTTKVVKNSHRGGAQPGERRGGRKKGTPNKKTAVVVAAAKAGGVMPLDYMLSVMRDMDADPSRRDDMAKASAPYVHPRLSTVEHGGKDGGPISIALKVVFGQ